MLRLEGNRIIVGLQMDCSVEQAWRLLTDTQKWHLWGPSVTDVSCEQRFIEADSTGKVRTLLGFWVPFTIDRYHHLRFWSWRVGPVAATGHHISVTDDGRCLVAFDLPWWALPYAIVCRIALGRIRRLLTAGGTSS